MLCRSNGDSMKQPETIALWKEMTGRNIFWWEPVGDAGMFRVEDTDGKQWFIMHDKHDIIEWEIIDVRSDQSCDS